MSALLDDIQKLSVPERIALAQAIWDSIADQHRPHLSEAKRAELARRAAEDDARPDDVVWWDQAKAGILARLGQS
jgi:putative addiction module component (TIGR02574 family)